MHTRTAPEIIVIEILVHTQSEKGAMVDEVSLLCHERDCECRAYCRVGVDGYDNAMVL